MFAKHTFYRSDTVSKEVVALQPSIIPIMNNGASKLPLSGERHRIRLKFPVVICARRWLPASFGEHRRVGDRKFQKEMMMFPRN